MSITSIENLSNELFYEIFDYLDGFDIYLGFSNLNQYFQQLLHSSSLLFRIKYYSKSEDLFINKWTQMICFNREQIYSLSLSSSTHIERFFSSLYTINSSFNRLESLRLSNFETDMLMLILVKLISLPRLFSLTIQMSCDSLDLTDTYRSIFNLPMLKYCQFLPNNDSLISLPIATNQQFSPIEHLVINHCCTFNEISTITSYTPKLRRLKFLHDLDSDLNTYKFSPVILTNLTYLSIETCSLFTFHKFEEFIKKFDCQLKVLCISVQSEDNHFIGAHRWQKLILEYLPQLEKFSLEYCEYLENDFVFLTDLAELNQFNSSFWIERQCLLEIEIDDEYIKYLIRPHKTRWYEYPKDNLELSKSTRLNIWDISSDKLIIKYIRRILKLVQIYHLEIHVSPIIIGLLIRIINLLPELNSLKIYCLSYDSLKNLGGKEFADISSRSDRRTITKIYVEQVFMIAEISLLTIFFPFIKYFKMDCINIINIKSFVRHVLKDIKEQSNGYLQSLCFRVSLADDEIIKTLQNMIEDEKLLFNYTIKRVVDNIYLSWK